MGALCLTVPPTTTLAELLRDARVALPPELFADDPTAPLSISSSVDHEGEARRFDDNRRYLLPDLTPVGMCGPGTELHLECFRVRVLALASESLELIVHEGTTADEMLRSRCVRTSTKPRAPTRARVLY